MIKYKRVTIEICGDDFKVWQVIHNDKAIGYIENDEDFGYIFYKDIDSDWLLGLETLRECKENLEELINKGKI